MKLAIIAIIAMLALLGCEATKGAVKDFKATVDTGKGILGLSYDPTNGVAIEAPADLLGPVKVYTPVPQNEK